MVMKLVGKKTVLVVYAVLLGCLVAILPLFIYPVSEMGGLLKSGQAYEALSPSEEYSRYYIGNNLIQVLTIILSATALSVVLWLYSKKII